MTIDIPSHVSLDTINAILALDRMVIVTINGESVVKDIPAFLMKEPK